MARAARVPLLVAVLALAACGDELTDPSWLAAADTAVLFSLARPELDLESAFSFLDRVAVPLERPGAATQWDVAVDTRAGQLVLLTPNAMGINSRARIAALPGQSFDLVVEAPADTLLYTATTPVPVQLTAVYVVRTNARSGGCSSYAKLQALAIDVAAGRLEFKYDTNPFCNDRRLVPPDTT
jgi:hypothetical protein